MRPPTLIAAKTRSGSLFDLPVSRTATEERRTAVFADLKCYPAGDHLGRVVI
jgi:hypothetical protein